MSEQSPNLTYLENILIMLFNCELFASSLVSLPSCSLKYCLVNEIKSIFETYKKKNLKDKCKKLLELIQRIALTNASEYYKMLNIIFLKCHEHTISHIHLSCPENCLFHSYFYINYSFSTTCQCNSYPKGKITAESFEFPIKLLSLQETPNSKEFKRKDYLKAYIGKLFKVNETQSCIKPDCNKYSRVEYKLESVQEYLILNIEHKKYPCK